MTRRSICQSATANPTARIAAAANQPQDRPRPGNAMVSAGPASSVAPAADGVSAGAMFVPIIDPALCTVAFCDAPDSASMAPMKR
jgi:hypothetical protein